VIEFHGPPPAFTLPADAGSTASWRGRQLTVTATDPAARVAALLAREPAAARQLQSIDLRPPTLDDLYRHLVHA
jgi:hypothetical protein